jgi:aryl-phospho-beta-D-glucosidase BglC (GH1 family)
MQNIFYKKQNFTQSITISLWGLLILGMLFLSSCGKDNGTKTEDEPEPESSEELVSSSSSVADTNDTNGSSSSSMDFEPVQMDAFEAAKKLGKGINMGNMLEAESYWQPGYDIYDDLWYWGETLNPDDFAVLADSGFNSVRIPVRWNAWAAEEAPYTISEDFFLLVDTILQAAHDAELLVVLNMHHYDEFYEDITHEERFYELWKQIASRYAAEGDYLIFEILNEPRGKLTPIWNDVMLNAIDTIRLTNPGRTLMVGGTDWNSINGLRRLQLPKEDKNIIATFHMYEPFKFTHQGASWSGNSPVGVKWKATVDEMQFIDDLLQDAVNFGEENGVPVHMGEFGAYSKADELSRGLWTEYVTYKATELGIPWHYWEFSAGFGVYDDETGEWSSTLMKALLHPDIDWDTFEYPRPELDSTTVLYFEDYETQTTGTAAITKFGASLQQSLSEPVDSAFSRWYVYYSDSSTFWNHNDDVITAGGDTMTASMVGPYGKEANGFYAKTHIYAHSIVNDDGDTVKAYPYIGFGAALAKDSSWSDFSAMQALSFSAKGSGTWRVKFTTEMASDSTLLDNTWGAFEYILNLQEDWTDFVIFVEDLTPSPWSALEENGSKWSEAASKVRNIEFTNGQDYGQAANDTLTIYVDDIKFWGMEASALSGETASE